MNLSLTCYSCGDSASRASNARARGWVHISGLLWICEPCDLAPRCRMCDAIATDATARLCVACAKAGAP